MAFPIHELVTGSVDKLVITVRRAWMNCQIAMNAVVSLLFLCLLALAPGSKGTLSPTGWSDLPGGVGSVQTLSSGNGVFVFLAGYKGALADSKGLASNAHTWFLNHASAYDTIPQHYLAIRGPTLVSSCGDAAGTVAADANIQTQLVGGAVGAQLLSLLDQSEGPPMLFIAGHSSGGYCMRDLITWLDLQRPQVNSADASFFNRTQVLVFVLDGAGVSTAYSRAQRVRFVYAWQDDGLFSLLAASRQTYLDLGYDACGVHDATSGCATNTCMHDRVMCSVPARIDMYDLASDYPCIASSPPARLANRTAEMAWLSPMPSCHKQQQIIMARVSSHADSKLAVYPCVCS